MARDRQGDRFERIIGQRLGAGREAGDAQCPDASIIAAYRERLLPPDERAECERHFAQCARCGSALAALARIDDADDAVARGGVGASTQAAGSDNRVRWKLRGALPIAAFGAAAAILLVVAIRTFSTPRGPIGSEARLELQAKSPAANAALSAMKPGRGALGGSNSLLAMNEPTPAQAASPSPPQKSFAANAPQTLAEAGSFAQRHLSPPPKAGPTAQEQGRTASRDELKEEKSRALELEKQSGEVASAPTAPAAAPAPPPLMASVGASTGAPATTREGAGAAVGTGTGALSGGGRSALSDMAAVGGSMPGANAIVVEPPDHTAVWMVGAHGAISRYSRATGWVPQTSGVTTDLTSGSAPSAATCWIVGRAGTILRTVDGEHWTTVVAPVSDDLTGVVALSASNATIFAAGGRRFATSDGGASWRQL